MENSVVKIIKAEEKDIPLILSFIRMIADYEKLSDEVVATEESLRKALFSGDSNTKVIFAYIENEPVGYAVYFNNFSTFVGRRGIYLEDIFIRPEYRRNRFGAKLFAYLIREAEANQYGRIEWCVLDWNKPALDFYNKMGAECMEEWKLYRLREKNFKAAIEILEKN